MARRKRERIRPPLWLRMFCVVNANLTDWVERRQPPTRLPGNQRCLDGWCERSFPSPLGSIELPAGGVVGKIVFCPSQHDAWSNGIEHNLRRGHQRHLVLGARSRVEWREPRLVGKVHLNGVAFENDDIIARLEVNGHCGILSQVAGFARCAGSAKEQGSVDPKTPDGDGVRATIGARGAYPVVPRIREPRFSMAERKILHSRFQPIHRGNVRQTYVAAGGISGGLFGGRFFRSLEFGHSHTPALRGGYG